MAIDKKIAFLGGGNMAEALIKGLIASGAANPSQIIATDPSADRREHLRRTYGIAIQKTNADAAREAGVVVLSVKPQVIDKVVGEISPVIDNTKLVISIAAGVGLAKILRIDPESVGERHDDDSPCECTYHVPEDNPFFFNDYFVPETWHWGLRNPWRFSFDRETGELYIGEVGQDELGLARGGGGCEERRDEDGGRADPS